MFNSSSLKCLYISCQTLAVGLRKYFKSTGLFQAERATPTPRRRVSIVAGESLEGLEISQSNVCNHENVFHPNVNWLNIKCCVIQFLAMFDESSVGIYIELDTQITNNRHHHHLRLDFVETEFSFACNLKFFPFFCLFSTRTQTENIRWWLKADKIRRALSQTAQSDNSMCNIRRHHVHPNCDSSRSLIAPGIIPVNDFKLKDQFVDFSNWKKGSEWKKRDCTTAQTAAGTVFW